MSPMMLRGSVLLLAAAFVAAKSASCEGGGSCEEAKSAALLQQRREDTKADFEESKSTTTTFTMIGNISSAKVGNLNNKDSVVDFEMKDGSHFTFKQTADYKRADSTDTYVGDSADGKSHLDLVKQLKPGCTPGSTDSNCYDLFASIVDESTGKVYQISPNANDKIEVTETNTNEFPEEASPPNETDGGMVTLLEEQEDYVESTNQDSIIDVLIVWTHLAECSQSRLSKGCTHTAQTEGNMRGLLKLAIDETNTAFELSGVKADLRLVHAYRDTTGYDESAGFSSALNAITSPTDGVMDDVHSKRQQYGADVVVLIISHNAYCGMAWLGPSKSRMFSVTSNGCATGYYSFGHEIAHNMGCHHDRGTSRACSSSASHYGYRDPQAKFRSIMAYGCRSGQCDNNKDGGCTRVQRFSNPTYKYQGLPIGSNVQDNAKQLNLVRATVAAYYTAQNSPPTPTSPPLTTAAPVTTAAPITTAAPKPGPDVVACNFERNLCGWSNDKKGVWRIGSRTPSSSTGPQKGGRTPNSKKFAYLEASAPNYPKPFKLISPSFDAPKYVFFTFFYNMNGASMGKLVLETYNGVAWSKLWEKSGNKGDVWTQTTVGIRAGTTQLRFVGTTKSWASDFALDDLSMSAAPPPKPTTTTTTTTTRGCYLPVSKFVPINMQGQGRTVAKSTADCQRRCASVTGCAHFSWWPNGGCHIQDSSSTWREDKSSTAGSKSCPPKSEAECKSACATAGYSCSRDSGCQRPSCQLGCEIAFSTDSAGCKAACKAATGKCSHRPAGFKKSASLCTSKTCPGGSFGGNCEAAGGCEHACDFMFPAATTQAPTTLPPATQAPTTLPPATQAPTTLPPTQPPMPTTQPPAPTTTTTTGDDTVPIIPIVVNASEADKVSIKVSIVK